MKRSILAALFVLVPSILCAQLTLNYEHKTDHTERVNTVSNGGSVHLMLPVSNVFVPGISAGFLAEKNTVPNTQGYQIPILATARYYVMGLHRCTYGIFIEGNAGATMHRSVSKYESETVRIQEARPQGSLGVGLRLLRSLEVNFRWGASFSDDKSQRFNGFRLGWSF